jgi:hypothetical protein
MKEKRTTNKGSVCIYMPLEYKDKFDRVHATYTLHSGKAVTKSKLWMMAVDLLVNKYLENK